MEETPRYPPHSIIWTSLPFLSWVVPCIGHVGITDSKGRTYDFSGDYMIAVDDFAFGPPISFCPLDQLVTLPSPNSLDRAILDASKDWGLKRHDIISNNCHHFCSDCIYRATARKIPVTQLAWTLVRRGKYLTPRLHNVLRQFLPSILFLSVLVLVILFFIYFPL